MEIISHLGACVEIQVGRFCTQTGLLFLRYIISKGTIFTHSVRPEGVVLAIQ